MQVLVLGCGYVGTAFGKRLLSRSAHVTGTCRSATRADVVRASGITPIVVQEDNNAELIELAESADIILASMPPADLGDPALNVLTTALNLNQQAWLGYLSTTGVYGNRDGGWAFEDDGLTPDSIEASRRCRAEAAWQSLPNPAHIFRLPGIYGPGRSALEQVRAGTARRIDKPGQLFSRAHREDIVTALLASIEKPNPGRVYNICDDLPCPASEVVLEACRLLKVTPPPLVPFADANLTEMGRRFYSECKRVSNARVKAELNWRPKFPTFREGLADCFVQT